MPIFLRQDVREGEVRRKSWFGFGRSFTSDGRWGGWYLTFALPLFTFKIAKILDPSTFEIVTVQGWFVTRRTFFLTERGLSTDSYDEFRGASKDLTTIAPTYDPSTHYVKHSHYHEPGGFPIDTYEVKEKTEEMIFNERFQYFYI